jgi:shikimate kinase/3-dehydroquinate synthase
VALVQAPTSLVAQVDSAYGGKTGVDLPEGKNYVGAYHLPAAALADTATLSTLPPEELAAGFVEVLKTGLLAGGPLWERVRAIESLDPAGLDELVFACARYKCAVVAADERDGGPRHVLNLGHTIGHAIEAAGGYSRYRHGEAVGLGLLGALRLSEAPDLAAEVEEILERHGLPVSVGPEIDPEAVLEALQRDKKRTSEGVGFVLLATPGEPREGQVLDPSRVEAAVTELYRR